jgi:hypothetical protein
VQQVHCNRRCNTSGAGRPSTWAGRAGTRASREGRDKAGCTAARTAHRAPHLHYRAAQPRPPISTMRRIHARSSHVNGKVGRGCMSGVVGGEMPKRGEAIDAAISNGSSSHHAAMFCVISFDRMVKVDFRNRALTTQRIDHFASSLPPII